MEIGSDFDDERYSRRMKRLSIRQNWVNNSSNKVNAVKKADFSAEADDDDMARIENMSRKRKNVDEYVVNGNSHGGGGGEPTERDDVDMQYIQFLKNLREDESSYFLVVKLDDDLELIYRYEPESYVKNHQSSETHSNRENSEAARRNPGVDPVSETCKNPKKRRLSSSEVREEAEMQDFDEWDEEYKHFLDNLKHEGDILVYKDSRYDEEEEKSSCSDVIILSPDEVPQDFVTSKPVSIDLDGDDCVGGDCEFRTKLVEELKMPFDAKQYEVLLREVKIRKPKKLERMLRGRDASYSTNQVCKSYLDSHPDFAEKIDSADGDEPKILNLLRGFFFWLKNVADVEPFKPWMDPSCLKILPELKVNASLKLENIEEI